MELGWNVIGLVEIGWIWMRCKGNQLELVKKYGGNSVKWKEKIHASGKLETQPF